MSIRLSLLLIFILFSIGINGKPVSSSSSDGMVQRINHLLNITQSENKFNSVLNAYISGDPNLSLFKTEMLQFIQKFLSFQSLRPRIVEIYRDLYTLADVNGIIKFYSSPAGKKLVEKENKAEVRLTQLIQEQLQKQMPQITAWFQEKLTKN